ncbi:MAG: AAA family ATPase [bacterium]|nr:AAA family ATPase [bacterium]
MLTKVVVRNFKRFRDVEIELGSPVLFIGPNNYGKTTALQALALWDVGLKRWNEKRKGQKVPEKRPGVTINRRDLVSLPISAANLLWKDLHVRDVRTIDGKPKTKNVRIDIIVEGVTGDKSWKCGLEFDYANEESFYCRPLRETEEKNPPRMAIPAQAESGQIAFLPPMSGLAANESRLDAGAIGVRIGEGRTAEVLRNLCLKVFTENRGRWTEIVEKIRSLFGSELHEPQYIPERGEIVMSYTERGTRLDLSCSGRGLQQTLLLLAYMYANPGAVLLLDEPDAHLEVLRQRQVYQLLTDVATENNSQVIAASHSEVLLREAAERDVVVAFLGKPHRINNRGSQVYKALREIGFEDYYFAEQTGWVLYLEGSTDLAILQSLARTMKHEAACKALERPFLHCVRNEPGRVQRHFFALQEAVPGLVGIAIFDRLDKKLPTDWGQRGMRGFMWKQRELENYLCYPETFEAYAKATEAEAIDESDIDALLAKGESDRRMAAMADAVHKMEEALATTERGSPWDGNMKVSEFFLTPLFKRYFEKLGLPNLMEKKNFHELASFVPAERIDPEIRSVLDGIADVAERAKPQGDVE